MLLRNSFVKAQALCVALLEFIYSLARKKYLEPALPFGKGFPNNGLARRGGGMFARVRTQYGIGSQIVIVLFFLLVV